MAAMSARSANIQVRAEPGDLQRFHAIAAGQGLTLSALIRVLLNAVDRGQIVIGALPPTEQERIITRLAHDAKSREEERRQEDLERRRAMARKRRFLGD